MANGVLLNIKVIGVMWLRQMKRYTRSRARMISSVGQPLLFLLAFWFGFGPIYAKAGGGNYLTFLAPGIIAMSILFQAMFNGMEVIWDRQFGFLKETMVAPVSRLTIMAGRTFGGATVAMLQGLIIFLVTLLIGFRPANMMLIIPAFVLMFAVGLLFAAVGTAFASVINDMHAFPLISNFIIMPLFFLSGALFPLDGLPTSIQMLTRFNPMSYCVDAIRLTLSGTTHLGIGMDVVVLLGCIVVAFAVGAWLFSRTEV
jgi:ABC-2 type transport system permease protein